MIYKYEMHLHTSPCSGGGEDIIGHIDDMLAKGLQGAVITNHFYRGDSRIDRSLPWEEYVDAYRKDYERGLEYAKKRDFDLFFGLEEHLGGGQEILIYGLSPDVIARHPELISASATEYADLVHAEGGLVYQAHPYRARAYVTRPHPLECIDRLDGIEVYNAANLPEWNERAAEFAKGRAIPTIGGSDAHSIGSAGRSGIATDRRIRTSAELVRILKTGEYKIFIKKGELYELLP